MADHPDFFADGYAITVGPFGITLTFQLSQPSLEPGAHIDPSVIVARARMSPPLAKALAQGLAESVVQQANLQQSDPTVKH